MFNSLIMDLSDVISVNRVRVLNIDLAVFDHIFLPDQSLKSTFAQNKSCRSSLPLQFLFWPNFKFLYEILSFNRSKLSQNQSNVVTVHLLCSPVHRTPPIPRSARRRQRLHASGFSANLAIRVHRLIHSPRPSLSISLSPFVLVKPRAKPEHEQSSSAFATPATPRRPASVHRAPTSLASP